MGIFSDGIEPTEKCFTYAYNRAKELLLEDLYILQNNSGSEKAAGNTLSGICRIKNRSQNGEMITLIMAVYNNNVLKTAAYKTEILQNGEEKTIRADINGYVVDEGDYEKLFLFNDTDLLEPLFNAERIKSD